MASPTPRLRGRAAVAQRKRRLEAAGYVCAKCGKVESPSNPFVVDHIIPLIKGGSDEDHNTRVLCEHPCHKDVTAEQFGHKKRVTIGNDGWPI